MKGVLGVFWQQRSPTNEGSDDPEFRGSASKNFSEKRMPLEIGAAVKELGAYDEQLRSRVERVVSHFLTMRTAEEEVTALINELGPISTAYLRQQKAIAELESALLTERDATASLRTAKNELINLVSDLEIQLEGVSAEKSNTQAQKAASEEKLRVLRDDLNEKSDHIRAMELELAAAKSDAFSVGIEKSNYYEKLRETESQLHQASEERRCLRETLLFESDERSKSSKAFDDLAALSIKQKQQINDLSTEIDKLRFSNKKYESDNEQLSVQLEKTIEKLHTAESQREIDNAASGAKLEASDSRMRLIEELLVNAREECRRLYDNQALYENTLQRLKTTQTGLENEINKNNELRYRMSELERSRDAGITRANDLTARIREEQVLNDQAEERIRILYEQMKLFESKANLQRSQLQDEIKVLLDSLEREKSHRAYAEGALQTARRDRVQLRGTIVQLKKQLSGGSKENLVELNNSNEEGEGGLLQRLTDSSNEIALIALAR